MKGPRARWKHDVRRLWECPACHRRERTGGDIVNLRCGCQTWMRLIEADVPSVQPVASEIGLQQPGGDVAAGQ